MEEDRKREERLKVERMAEVKQIADKIVDASMKSMKEGENMQVVPQNHPMCMRRPSPGK
jgi:hypothetical protein